MIGGKVMNIHAYSKGLNLLDLNKKAVAIWVDRILRCGLAGVLAVAGLAKLMDSSELLATLHQIPFISSPLAIWIATLLPVVELSLAGALFFSWKLTATLPVACALFAGFLGFAVYGIIIHLTGGCGCFGDWAESGFGWGMVLRNSILFFAAGLLWAANRRS